jgi:hypothetical protein
MYFIHSHTQILFKTFGAYVQFHSIIKIIKTYTRSGDEDHSITHRLYRRKCFQYFLTLLLCVQVRDCYSSACAILRRLIFTNEMSPMTH